MCAVLSLAIGLLLASTSLGAIDRLHIVEEHNVRRIEKNSSRPFQVGNGNIAYNIDITGTQSIRSFKTLSTWGRSPLPVSTDVGAHDEDGNAMSAAEPWTQHINLARIGLLWNGKEMQEDLFDGSEQTLHLTSGIVTSTFNIGIEPVDVETLASPSLGAIGLRVQSESLRRRNLSVFIEMPPVAKNKSGAAPEQRTTLRAWGPRAEIKHELDNMKYFVNIQWESGSPTAQLRRVSPGAHRYVFDIEDATSAEFVFHFTPDSPAFTPGFATIKKESTHWWRQFWTRGAFFDCAATSDPRAAELERLAILSQYNLAVNTAGSAFVSDSGLTGDTSEKTTVKDLAWPFLAHWQRWNRWDRVSALLPIAYQRSLLSVSRASQDSVSRLQASQPSLSHVPDPYYFAEQEYQALPTSETLVKWRMVLEKTATSMIKSVIFDNTTKRYRLPTSTSRQDDKSDSVFTSAYWRFGLSTMIKWRERLDLSADSALLGIYEGLSPFSLDPATNAYRDSRAARTYSTVAGVYGMLPPDPYLNLTTFKHTLDNIDKEASLNRNTSLMSPLQTMAVIRSGNSTKAVDLLLHESLTSDDLGISVARDTGQTHLSNNGGLLMAIAMLANGWANSTGPHWPSDWHCAAEGFNPGL